MTQQVAQCEDQALTVFRFGVDFGNFTCYKGKNQPYGK